MDIIQHFQVKTERIAAGKIFCKCIKKQLTKLYYYGIVWLVKDNQIELKSFKIIIKRILLN